MLLSFNYTLMISLNLEHTNSASPISQRGNAHDEGGACVFSPHGPDTSAAYKGSEWRYLTSLIVGAGEMLHVIKLVFTKQCCLYQNI